MRTHVYINTSGLTFTTTTENAIDDFDNFSPKNIAQLVNPMQWSPSPESHHHSKIENQKQVIGRSQVCILLETLGFFPSFCELSFDEVLSHTKSSINNIITHFASRSITSLSTREIWNFIKERYPYLPWSLVWQSGNMDIFLAPEENKWRFPTYWFMIFM